jgi:hypothetical protein
MAIKVGMVIEMTIFFDFGFWNSDFGAADNKANFQSKI